MQIHRHLRPFVVSGLLAAFALTSCTPAPAPVNEAVVTTTPAVTRPPELVSASPTSSPEAATEEVSPELVDSLNDFSRKLYSEVAKEEKGNLAVSPLGSFFLLQMLYEASANSTREELSQVLGFSAASLSQTGTLSKRLVSVPGLSIGQKIYLDKKAKLVESYLKRVGPWLAEPVQLIPFATDPTGAVKIVNDWVELRTRGTIKNFLEPLPTTTVSTLVSTLYFKGQWQTPFPKESTSPSSFVSSGQPPFQVPMMTVSLPGLEVLEVPGGQAVVLPYTDDIEMLLILPDEGVGTEAIWKQLDLGVGRGKRPDGEGGEVVVSLPRFKFETPTMELTQIWQHLGLKESVTSPDLSAMLTWKSPPPLGLSVFHKAYLHVDEEGTEASAATGVAIGVTSIEVEAEPPKSIRFDRPFNFVLRHSQSGAVLMLGRVEEPEKV